MKDKYIKWLQDLGFYPVNDVLWNVLEINHKKPENELEKRRTEEFLKKKVGDKRGLYIYESFNKEILYVGKGNTITSRLISHYKESFQTVPGDSKDQKWHRFFKTHAGALRVYWKELDGEKERQVIEKMLDNILSPKFNDFINIPPSGTQVKSFKKEDNNIATKKDSFYSFGDYGEEIINKVIKILGNSFTPKYNKTGVTFFGYKGRILKIIKREKYLEVEFNVPVKKVQGLTILSDKEARDKKMGTCKWIYKGESLSAALRLVEEALENY